METLSDDFFGREKPVTVSTAMTAARMTGFPVTPIMLSSQKISEWSSEADIAPSLREHICMWCEHALRYTDGRHELYAIADDYTLDLKYITFTTYATVCAHWLDPSQYPPVLASSPEEWEALGYGYATLHRAPTTVCPKGNFKEIR